MKLRRLFKMNEAGMRPVSIIFSSCLLILLPYILFVFFITLARRK